MDAIYLHRVQRRMSKKCCSFDSSSSRESGNEWTGQSDTENVAYNCTLTYGTCESLGSVYYFFMNVYDISYSTVLSIKDLINEDG